MIQDDTRKQNFKSLWEENQLGEESFEEEEELLTNLVHLFNNNVENIYIQGVFEYNQSGEQILKVKSVHYCGESANPPQTPPQTIEPGRVISQNTIIRRWAFSDTEYYSFEDPSLEDPLTNPLSSRSLPGPPPELFE